MKASASGSDAGHVVSIFRYPVKSMMGEEVAETQVTERGVVGDRGFALVDLQTGRVASAKNPRQWPNLFEFAASYLDTPTVSGKPARVRIALPDGASVTTDEEDVDSRLSAAVGRGVRLAGDSVPGATAEGYWPDHDWLADRDRGVRVYPPGRHLFRRGDDPPGDHGNARSSFVTDAGQPLRAPSVPPEFCDRGRRGLRGVPRESNGSAER